MLTKRKIIFRPSINFAPASGILSFGIKGGKEAGAKFFKGDMTPYGWEKEYDEWLKKQLDDRNIKNLIDYEKSTS